MTNEKKKIGRPFVSIQIGGQDTTALYDTGADISCFNEKLFRKIPPTNRLEMIPSLAGQEIKSANGNFLEVKGAYTMMMRILGKHIKHRIFVVRNLSEPVILGSDFIYQHQLSYCPIRHVIYWPGGNQRVKGHAQLASEVRLSPFSVQNVRVNLYTEDGARPRQRAPMIVNVISVVSPLITGGPALIEADSAGQAIIELYNCGPDTVDLPRKEPIATMENPETFDMERMSPEVIVCFSDTRNIQLL
jgi:hypothetical protein